ncbi:MAG: 50S ribosomal protein L18 [Myxococcales bacterium]|nr:50S ribosomal protein L18 [Myxococcales bacterium]
MLGKIKISPREHRKNRLRFTIRGTAERPRMNVFRSAKHIYVQIIDDDAGATLAAASTIELELRQFEGNKTAAAEAVGRLAAERALAKGIKKLVFDRAGYIYTGRVAAVSKRAHELGLLTRAGVGAAEAGTDAGTEADEVADANADAGGPDAAAATETAG